MTDLLACSVLTLEPTPCCVASAAIVAAGKSGCEPLEVVMRPADAPRKYLGLLNAARKNKVSATMNWEFCGGSKLFGLHGSFGPTSCILQVATPLHECESPAALVALAVLATTLRVAIGVWL